jgi:hypothetical protein
MSSTPEFVHAFGDVVADDAVVRLQLPVLARQLVQRQPPRRRTGGRRSAPWGGTPPAPFSRTRQVVGNGDGLGVRHQEAVVRPFQRRPAAHARGDAGPLQHDGGVAAVAMALRVGRPVRSCVPQPSSAGCRPSSTKPSTDQVLTNSPRCLRCGVTCVSRSAMWITFTSSLRASAAHSSDRAAVHLRRFRSAAMFEQRLP